MVTEQTLKNQIALVTGGSSGIGRAAAIALADAGANVMVAGRREDALIQTLESIGERLGDRYAAESFAYCMGDVRSPEDTERMTAATLERFGRIDILVAAAGIGGTRDPERSIPYAVVQLPVEAWDEVIDINLKGIFLSDRAVLPAMIRQGSGTIVNVSSARGAKRGMAYSAAYCASKHGVMGLTESLAQEVGRLGIRVCAVLPDVTDTPMLHVRGGMAPEGLLDPDDVADLIVDTVAAPPDTMYVDTLIAPFSPQSAEV